MRHMLSRIEPDARLLARLRNRMDHLFEEFVGDFPVLSRAGFFGERAYPPLNLWEDEKNVYVECEIPGVSMKDLDLSVVGNELSIKGEWKHEKVEKATFHREERLSGSFSRVVRLPIEIDSEKVTAELKNGVLTMTLPKAVAALPRKIAVKAIEG